MQIIELEGSFAAYPQVVELYEKSFNEAEKFAVEELDKLSKQPGVKIFAICNENNRIDSEVINGFAGFAFVMETEVQAFVFYLAISSELRGTGYGSGFLAALTKYYAGQQIVLEIATLDSTLVDIPDMDVRQKRKQFYVRNGLVDSGYSVTENGTPYDLLIGPGEFCIAEFMALLDHYLPPKVQMQVVRHP